MEEKAGLISRLQYQPSWVLCKRPKITYTADFAYVKAGSSLHTIEDVKGVLTRETRVKLAWLKEKFGIEVTIIR